MIEIPPHMAALLGGGGALLILRETFAFIRWWGTRKKNGIDPGKTHDAGRYDVILVSILKKTGNTEKCLTKLELEFARYQERLGFTTGIVQGNCGDIKSIEGRLTAMEALSGKAGHSKNQQ